MPFARAYSLVSEQRRLATHQVREAAHPFKAFEQFTEDLKLCIDGLNQLRGALEGICGMDAEKSNDRWRKILQLPKLVQPPEGLYAVSQLSGMTVLEARHMVGKTISNVEFGFRESIKNVHKSELIIIHFTDGSMLSVETGSNAENLSNTHSELTAEDFHVDFILQWVPPLSELTVEGSTSQASSGVSKKS